MNFRLTMLLFIFIKVKNICNILRFEKKKKKFKKFSEFSDVHRTRLLFRYILLLIRYSQNPGVDICIQVYK